MTGQHSIVGRLSAVLRWTLLCAGCKEEATGPPMNHNPTITSIVAFPDNVHSLDSLIVFCSAFDVDGDSLRYDWFCTSGASIKGANGGFYLSNTRENFAVIYAPDSAHTSFDSIRIFVDVRDLKGGGASGDVFVSLNL